MNNILSYIMDWVCRRFTRPRILSASEVEAKLAAMVDELAARCAERVAQQTADARREFDRRAAEHAAATERLNLETECLRILVNCGVAKFKSRADFYNARN